MTKVIKRNEYTSLASRTGASFYTTDPSIKKPPFSHTHYSSLSSHLSTAVNKHNKHKSSYSRSRNTNVTINTTSNVDSFHFSYLRSKLQMNPEYQCLTDRTNVFLTTDSTQHSHRPSLSQITYKHNSTYGAKCSINNNTHNKHLRYHYIPVIPTKTTNETVSQFLSKTTALARYKYLHVIQQEKQTQYVESQETKSLESEMNMYSLLSTKQLLDEYNNNLYAYVKYLRNEIEINRQEVKQYMNTIHNLLREIKRLNQMIMKRKNEITFYKMYKAFFLCVKYKVLNVNQLPIETQIHYHLIKPRSLQLSQHQQHQHNVHQRKTLFTNNNNNNNNRTSIYNSSRGSLTSHIKHNTTTPLILTNASTTTTNAIINKEEDIIFTSIDDFERCFNKIETNTMKLFTSHNTLLNEIKLLKYTKSQITEEDTSHDVITTQEEKRLIMKLNSIKSYNINLKKHVAQLERHGMSIANSKRKLLIKVMDVLWSLPFDLEKEFECKGIYKMMKMGNGVVAVNSSMKVNAVVFYLSVIEKVVVYVLQQHRMLIRKCKQSVDISKIKGVIDMRKRLMNSQEKIRNERIRREKMNEYAMIKFNKVLFLQNNRKSITIRTDRDNNNTNTNANSNNVKDTFNTDIHSKRKKKKYIKGRNNYSNELYYEMLTY